jgi:hypothetical protein
LRQISPGVGSIGATIWFDRLLLSLAAAIQEQDLAGAAELVSQGLDLYAPNLNAYYPRLCAMEAGVEILAGQPAAARETLGFVQWSAAASKSEQSWVRLFEKDEGWRRTPKELVTGSESHFWFAWLNWAFQVSQANEAEAEQQLAKTKGCRLSLAQKGFVETLRKATPELIKAETKRRTTPANQTGSVKPRAEGG